jgi:hypothetical protein
MTGAVYARRRRRRLGLAVGRPGAESHYRRTTRSRGVRVDDLATDPRWPQLARRAAQLGVASVLCFQLFVHDDDLGR